MLDENIIECTEKYVLDIVKEHKPLIVKKHSVIK